MTNISDSETPLARVRKIEQQLRSNGQVRVAQLARELRISEVTVRRYLDQLVERGLAERSRGGAVLLDAPLSDPLFTARRSIQHEAKTRVGRQCADLIPPSASLFLGGGTTTCEVARFLAGRSDLTIYTSNLAAGSQFRSDGATVYVLGGVIRGVSCSLVGDFAYGALRRIRADFAVIGADGISSEVGAMNDSSEEAAVTRQMVENARLGVFCVVDSSKWGTHSGYVTALPEELTVVVADEVPHSEREAFERIGVRVVLAQEDESALGQKRHR